MRNVVTANEMTKKQKENQRKREKEKQRKIEEDQIQRSRLVAYRKEQQQDQLKQILRKEQQKNIKSEHRGRSSTTNHWEAMQDKSLWDV
jgi:16S rRNA C1402 (ribose-2'-O) methylase RsmI